MDRRKNSAVVFGTLAVIALFLNSTTSYAVGQQGTIATSTQTTALSAGQAAVLSTPIMIAGDKAFTPKPPTGPNQESRTLLRNSKVAAWPTICFEFVYWKYCI